MESEKITIKVIEGRQIDIKPGHETETDDLYPESLTVTKGKTTYDQDEELDLSDVVVTCTYKGGTSRRIDNYNVSPIDTSFAGYKTLTVTYVHNGISVSADIGITVRNTDSYNGTQLAYKVLKSGILKNGTAIVTCKDKLVRYGRLKVRIKATVVVEQNDNSNYTTLGFGNYNAWGSNTLGQKFVLNPKQVGEFDFDTNMELDYDHATIQADTIILSVYHNAGNKIQGCFELKDVSITYIEPIEKVPMSISVTKVQTRAVIGDDFITDDITARVTYNTEEEKAIVPEITIPDIRPGDNEIAVSYSENDHTVSTTINIHYYAADKTEPDEFHDLTAKEWCEAWHKGVNWGNCLDSKANSSNTIPGDTTHTGDGCMEQETAWGQPEATLKNFQDIKAKGFDMVRIPITWCYNSYTEPSLDENGLTKRHIGRFWACRAREVVDMALEAGLYVLINMHHEQPIIFTASTSTNMRQAYKNASDLWKEIADKFKHYNEKLAFEGYNEVDNLKSSFNFGAEAAEQMNTLNQIFVNTVRASGSNNARRVLHCPTTVHMWTEPAMKAYVVPTDSVSDHIACNVHNYSAAFLQNLDSEFSTIEKYSNLLGVPVCIGEWGTNTSSGSWEFRGRHAQNFIARAKYHHLYPVFWDNGSDYELVKRYNTKQHYGHTEEQCQLVIDGIMKGYDEMKAFKAPDDQIRRIDKIEDVTLLNWSPEKGFYNSYWGYCSVILPAESGKKYIVSLERSGLATELYASIAAVDWLRSTTLADGTIEYSKVSGEKCSYHEGNRSGIIPDNVNSVVIKVNSPDKNITDKQWAQIFEENELAINFIQYAEDDIQEVQLTERVPVSIQAEKQTTAYLTLNDTLETDDISVSVVFNDGFTRILSADEYTVDTSSVDMGVKGQYEIRITAEVDGVALSDIIEILVGKLLQSIESTSTLSVKVGSAAIDHGNVIVTAVYSDESRAEVTGFTFDESAVNLNQEGTYPVEISYSEGSIERTYMIDCVVYSNLMIRGIESVETSKYTYAEAGQIQEQGYTKETPDIINCSSIQTWMSTYFATDADCAYLTALDMNDIQSGTDIALYIPKRYTTNLYHQSADVSRCMTKNIKGGIAQKINYEIVADSLEREWHKYVLHYTDEALHDVRIASATIPVYYIEGEADLADIIIEN